MAERCALFVIIALDESLLVSGATVAKIAWEPATIMAFITVVIGTFAMWWIYFNIGAEEAVGRFRTSDDPGRIARLAYTYLHLPIIAGIIVTAVSDELVLAHPHGATDAKTAATLIGGPLLLLVGNLLLKRATAGRWPLSHQIGLGLLVVRPGSGRLVWQGWRRQCWSLLRPGKPCLCNLVRSTLRSKDSTDAQASHAAGKFVSRNADLIST